MGHYTKKYVRVNVWEAENYGNRIKTVDKTRSQEMCIILKSFQYF